MNFGISDNSCMFAMRTANSHANLNEGYFYGLMSAIILSDIRLLLSPWIAFVRLRLEFANLGKGSLSLFNNFKFHTGMANSNEHLKDGAKIVLSSTPDSAKTASKSQSKLEKEIATIQKKVAMLQAECKTHEAEKYRLLCYIDRYCSCLLSNFLENNPLGSRDWKKLHKQQLDLREAIK